MKKIRLAILDDHPLIVAGVQALVMEHETMELVLGTSNPEYFLNTLKADECDIAIIDLVLPGYQGLQFIKILKQRFPEISILIYSSLGNRMLVENLFKTGVMGYVNKNDSLSQLSDAILHIRNGQKYIPEGFQDAGMSNPEQVMLSERELEILKLISKEMSSTAIAEKLFISENTVEKHRKQLFQKLQVKNVAGLVREGYRQGYISDY